MTHVEAVHHALIHHLRAQLPALKGHLYAAAGAPTGLCLATPAAAGNASIPPEGLASKGPSAPKPLAAPRSGWLHGPSWRRNVWAACLPDPVTRNEETFTRFYAPSACDLLYDVLLLDRCPADLLTVAAQLQHCVAHQGTVTAPLMNNEHQNTEERETHHSYELAWESDFLSRDVVNTSGWQTLSGRLRVEGVLVDGVTIAQQGPVARQPVRLEAQSW